MHLANNTPTSIFCQPPAIYTLTIPLITYLQAQLHTALGQQRTHEWFLSNTCNAQFGCPRLGCCFPRYVLLSATFKTKILAVCLPAMLNLAVQGWDAAFLGACSFQTFLVAGVQQTAAWIKCEIKLVSVFVLFLPFP